MSNKKYIIFTKTEKDAKTVSKFVSNRFGIIIEIRNVATRFALFYDPTDRDERQMALIEGHAKGVYDAIRGQTY